MGEEPTDYPANLPVITGAGVISPIGFSIPDFWANLSANHSGIKKISKFDTKNLPVKVAAEIPPAIWERFRGEILTRRQIKAYSLNSQYAVAAAKLAFDDSGILELDPDRLGVYVGVGAEAHLEQITEMQALPEFLYEYQENVDPTLAGKAMVGAPGPAIALEFGAEGDVQTFSNACASAASAIGMASRMIRAGEADVIICGGTEAPVNWLTMSVLSAAGFLTDESNPDLAVCPFDLRRKISTMGEGAGILILESLQHAMARGAKKIYGTLSNYKQSTENQNPYFTPDDTGRVWAKNIARVSRGKVDVIHGHGPGHIFIDKVEAEGIRSAFPGDFMKIPVVSIKGAIGSGLSSGCALQTVATLLMLFNQVLLPTCNYRIQDPEIGLPVATSNIAGKSKMDSIVQNIYALGGYMATLLFTNEHRKWI